MSKVPRESPKPTWTVSQARTARSRGLNGVTSQMGRLRLGRGRPFLCIEGSGHLQHSTGPCFPKPAPGLSTIGAEGQRCCPLAWGGAGLASGGCAGLAGAGRGHLCFPGDRSQPEAWHQACLFWFQSDKPWNLPLRWVQGH